MNTNIKFALSAVAALGMTAGALVSAQAADLVYEEPAPVPMAPITHAPVATWAGPYAGIHLGYGFGGRVSEPGNRITTDGFIGGGFGGFNLQNGQFVYGLEADVNYNNMRGSNAGVNARVTGIDGSVRARLGFAATDDVLLYGTAGVAGERLRIRDTVVGDSDTKGMLGYTVGAGVDARLTDQVFARAEYRFTDYGRQSFSIGGVDRRFDSHNHRVTVGLGVKF